MVKITNTYKGELRCESTHEPSSSTLQTDAPVDNNGKGETFSPTDLVVSALANCIMTIMGIVAERKGVDLTGIHIDAEKHMVAEPVRRIGEIRLKIRMPLPESDSAAELFVNAAETCPVHKSIHPDIKVPITWIWS